MVQFTDYFSGFNPPKNQVLQVIDLANFQRASKNLGQNSNSGTVKLALKP